MITVENYILFPDFQTNTWLIIDQDSKESILIDPSAPSPSLLESIQQRNLTVNMIMLTHGHGDHIGGVGFFRRSLDAQVAIHPDDELMLTSSKHNYSDLMGTPVSCRAAEIHLTDEQEFRIGKSIMRVIHTPGHTRGCVCLYLDSQLISGDTLFEQSIGRTDLPGGSHTQIISSIKDKLFVLPDNTIVYPGHGPKTTIGIEKKTNPFIS